MSVRTFCDVCKEEIVSINVGKAGWTVESGAFRAVVRVLKGGKEGGCDLCLTCLLKMLSVKPRRKYERKAKVERQLVMSDEKPVEISTFEVKTPPSVDISTFEVKTPPSSEEPFILSLDEVSVTEMSINKGVKELMGLAGIDQQYIENAPQSEGKRMLLAILEGGK